MANNKKIDLSNLKMKEINDLTAEFYDSKQIFTANFQQLGKSFLNKVLSIDLWVSDFDKIRKTFIEDSKSNDKEVPDNEEGFYKYIVDIYFQLKQEPKQKLLDTYISATQHIQEIDDRIAKINEEIDTIIKLKNQEVYQKKVPLLTFYSNLNKDARIELIEFLKKGIYDYVISECSAGLGIGLWNTLQYEYALLGSKNYDVSYPNMISNKFMDLIPDEKEEMERIYDKDKPAFQKALKEYIENNDIIDNIRLLYDKNHIVAKKKEILEQCIIAYENDSKIVSGGLSIFIIEGILHEICSLFDITENELLGMGLKEKLDFLQYKLSYELHYEYYSFAFRILRNKMAHGIAESNELKEMADLLLLDIKDSIGIATSMRIPMNQKRFFIHQALIETSSNKYNYVFGYLNTYKIPIDPFYDIQNDILKVHSLVQENSFWNYIDNLVNHGNLYGKSFAESFIKSLLSCKIEHTKDKCVIRLKKLSNFQLEEFDKNRFINSLLGFVRYV
ncbi:MAG: hypothetical protein J0M37_15550 [Ignavibacteria bacterium]|nr:hypothetical protein [Ignavibacteria bacterium]